MKRREVRKESTVKDRGNGGQQGRCVEEKGYVTAQRKEECSLGRVQAGLVIKNEIKEQLQGSLCFALLCGSVPLPMTGSRTWLQHLWGSPVLGTRVSAGCCGTEPPGLSCPQLWAGGFPLLPCVFQPQQKREAAPG